MDQVQREGRGPARHPQERQAQLAALGEGMRYLAVERERVHTAGYSCTGDPLPLSLLDREGLGQVFVKPGELGVHGQLDLALLCEAASVPPQFLAELAVEQVVDVV